MGKGHKTVRFEIVTAEGSAEWVISFLPELDIRPNYRDVNGTLYGARKFPATLSAWTLLSFMADFFHLFVLSHF